MYLRRTLLLLLALPVLGLAQAPTLQGPTTISGPLTIPATGSLVVQPGASVSLPDNALQIGDTAGLQTALDGKQPLDSDLTAIAALTTTAHGRGLLDDADAAASRASLGLGSLATASTVTAAQISDASAKGRTLIQSADVEPLTAAEKTKLAGIAAGATANSTDAQLRDRATHTGTQSAATITGLATVATSGSYADLSNRPTLGTAAALNVAATGNAAVGEVVRGNDTRLTDARTPLAHNQAWSTITSTPTTLAGYGITDGITAATAASTYQPLDSDLTAYAGAADAAARRNLLGATGGVFPRNLVAASAIGDVTGLASALDLKAPLASPTLSNPTFTGTVTVPDGALAIADTNGLQTALDALQPEPRVVSSNTTAALNEVLHVVANATISDPPSPVEGRGYTFLVRNGTATVNSVAYTEGVWARIFHSGSYDTRRIGFTTTTTIPAASLPAATASTQGAVLLGGSTATAAATVDQLSQRQVASWFVNDTVTSGRGIVYSNATRQNIAGVPVVQIAFEMVVPTSNPTTTVKVAEFSSGIGVLSNPVAFALGIWLGTTGQLRVDQRGANLGTDAREFGWNGFRSAYSGQRVRGLVTVTSGVVNPVINLNGVDVSSFFTPATNGAFPQWLDNTLVSTNFYAGLNWPTADHPTVIPILGAMSAGEASTWFSTGRLPAWVSVGGSVVPAYASDFSAGADGWTTNVTGNIDGILGEDNTLRGQLAAASIGAAIGVRMTNTVLTGKYRVRFRYYQPTRRVRLNYESNLSVNLTTTGAWTIYDAEHTGFNYLRFVTIDSGDAEFYIKDFTVTPLGALTIPGAQGIGTARDLTTLGGTQPNQGRLVGVRPVLTGPAPRNIAIFPLSTTGAFLTLGSGNPLAYTPQRIMRAEVIVDTAGADLTFRNNSSSTNDIVTALTDIPSANTATALTLIAAQTRLAPGATVWGSLSAGTGFLVVETADTL